MWSIKIHLDGLAVPYELCQASSPEAVGRLLAYLCAQTNTRPITVERVPYVQPEEPFPTLHTPDDEPAA